MSVEDLAFLIERLFPNAPDLDPSSDAPPSSVCPGPHIQLQSPLFRLPRELRDVIYEHYAMVQDGLVHDFETNKLATGDGGSIDLSLMLTCRLAAEQMRGLHLKLNSLPRAQAYSMVPSTTCNC
jgi:hypothetical protein